MINTRKGQGALEYLLLIGGAVIIATIVVALLVGMNQSSKQGIHDNANTTTKIIENSPLAPILINAHCNNQDSIILEYNLFEDNQPSGSTAQVVIDGSVALDLGNNPIEPNMTPMSTTIINICAGAPHSIQIRVITSSGNFIDSNPLVV